MTYNPGDALFGNGRRETLGETGAVGAFSSDFRGNNGDNVCRVLLATAAGIRPLSINE